MAKLRVVSVENSNYDLINEDDNKSYKLNLTFYGLNANPKQGDVLGFHDELLDKNYSEYSNSYQFGPLDEPYGRDVKSSKDIDCIVLVVEDKKIYLKRFFG